MTKSAKQNFLPRERSMKLELDVTATIFRSDLLNNWNDFRRFFAWRETENPFHILISEILLQKTNARTVESVYNMVVEKYPTPHMLSLANPDELILILKPLGLAYRAERLIAISNTIVNKYEGSVPDSLNELLSLPGVGNYVARAVACFAFNQAYLPWDTNMVRISERVFNLYSSMSRPRTDIKLADYLGSFLLAKSCVRVKEIVWSMLDFASSICTARNPKCEGCFAFEYCSYRDTFNALQGEF